MKRTHRQSRIRLVTIGACLGAAATGAMPLQAESAAPSDSNRIQKLEDENKALRDRLDALEVVAKKDGTLATTNALGKTFKFLSESTLSGFVSASYFYDTSNPPGGSRPLGYLWSRHDSFTLNKVEVALDKPVERSGDKWDAGYNVIMIWGDDSTFVNTGKTPGTGVPIQGLESLRQAYVDVNVPLGTGLDIKAGQLISLMNFESGNGGASNPNFSQGNQWFITGNGPSTGVQAGYVFNDYVDLRTRVQNGLFTGAVDNNGFKTMMGSLGLHPDKKTGINLIGFGGREGASDNLWLKGGSVIASRQLCETYNLNFATEFDYFSLDKVGGASDWWSIGGWLWTDFTPKVGVALRADYLSDPDGTGTSGLLGFPANKGQALTSVTFTVNLRPVPSIKIQPEIRYDHTSLGTGFGTSKDRWLLGMGVTYLF